MYIKTYLFLMLAYLMLSADANADDPSVGMLMLGNDQPALLLETKVKVEVNGPLVNVRLTQEFFNPGANYSSAKYLFPLPENAAVNAMQMEVDGRLIVGSIAEKQAAERTYQAAKDNGQQAALTEVLSANVFQTRVAHVAAGDTISVQLDYREILAPDGDHYSLRIPTTLTPRYSAARPNLVDTTHGNEVQQLNASYELPTFNPHFQSAEALPIEQLNILSLEMQLQPGLPIINVDSSSHVLAVKQALGDSYQVSLMDEYDVMDRDLLISWTLEPSLQPRTVIMREELADADGVLHEYGLFMLHPPSTDWHQASQAQAGLPREIVLILDNSGSMAGTAMEQAKSSVAYALESLTSTDRFNLIVFNNMASQFSENSQIANSSNIIAAIDYVADVEAGGGTNMVDALNMAFSMPDNANYLRQLVFITDGAVSQEQVLLQMIEQGINDARLFTVAIGAAPNTFFMRKAAQLGRGSVHQVAADTDMQLNMDVLLAQLNHPALTNIEYSFLSNGHVVGLDERYLPDLYLGEPVVFTAQFEQWPDTLKLSGFDGTPWQKQIDLAQRQSVKGVGALWGKHRTDELFDDLMLGGTEAVLKPQIIDIALQHQLLTPFTSFVAVEQRVVNRDVNGTKEQQLANHLPNNQLQLPATGLGLNGMYALLLMAFTCWCGGLWGRRAEEAIV